MLHHLYVLVRTKNYTPDYNSLMLFAEMFLS